jgi:hypothetical protein
MPLLLHVVWRACVSVHPSVRGKQAYHYLIPVHDTTITINAHDSGVERRSRGRILWAKINVQFHFLSQVLRSPRKAVRSEE